MHEMEFKKWLREITSIDFFKAEIALENDEISKMMKKLASLDLSPEKLALSYAELRGGIRAIQNLQAIRKQLTESQS